MSLKKGTLLLLLGILLLCILFESFQQYYYIVKFNLGQDVVFLDILSSQSYRWIIWSVLAFILYAYSLNRSPDKTKGQSLGEYSALILGLVMLNITIISLIQYLPAAAAFSLSDFLYDYVVFFAVQKGPVFTLGYISVSVVLYLFVENSRLTVGIQQLRDLRQVNKSLYSKLKSANGDLENILTVKVGNKYKAVAINTITYIEADDYCVNIYGKDDNVYVMRISLKALEKILPGNFVRIHRKFIVNVNSIDEFNPANRTLSVSNDKILSISRNNISSIKSQFAARPLNA